MKVNEAIAIPMTEITAKVEHPRLHRKLAPSQLSNGRCRSPGERRPGWKPPHVLWSRDPAEPVYLSFTSDGVSLREGRQWDVQPPSTGSVTPVT